LRTDYQIKGLIAKADPVALINRFYQPDLWIDKGIVVDDIGRQSVGAVADESIAGYDIAGAVNIDCSRGRTASGIYEGIAGYYIIIRKIDI